MKQAEFDYKIMVCRCCLRRPSSTQRTGISNDILKIEQHLDCCIGMWDAPTDGAPEETKRLVAITGPILSTFGCKKSLSFDPFTCTILRGTKRYEEIQLILENVQKTQDISYDNLQANLCQPRPVHMGTILLSHLHQQVRIATFVMMKACVHVNIAETGSKTLECRCYLRRPSSTQKTGILRLSSALLYRNVRWSDRCILHGLCTHWASASNQHQILLSRAQT